MKIFGILLLLALTGCATGYFRLNQNDNTDSEKITRVVGQMLR